MPWVWVLRGSGGEAVISSDPRFVRDADDGGDGWGFGGNDDFGILRLRWDSPAIDAGDNDAAGVDGIETDLDGRERFFNVLGVADTGNGAQPIVDMGAYEKYQKLPDLRPVPVDGEGGDSVAATRVEGKRAGTKENPRRRR